MLEVLRMVKSLMFEFVKTGEEIAEELFCIRDAEVCHPEINKDVIRKETEMWVSLPILQKEINKRKQKHITCGEDCDYLNALNWVLSLFSKESKKL